MNAEHAFDAEKLSELAGAMRRVWHQVVSVAHKDCGLEGLQKQQFWVLGALSSGSRRMSDLAQCTQVSQASLTGIVDRLVEHGLVERTRQEEDRRVVEVRLTETGRGELTRANDAWLLSLEAILEPLSPAEKAEFSRLVGMMAKASRIERTC